MTKEDTAVSPSPPSSPTSSSLSQSPLTKLDNDYSSNNANTNTYARISNLASSRSPSISPISSSCVLGLGGGNGHDETEKKSLKRSHENSSMLEINASGGMGGSGCNGGLLSSNNNSINEASSPITAPPPVKQSKMSYSIMSLLSSETTSSNNNNKKFCGSNRNSQSDTSSNQSSSMCKDGNVMNSSLDSETPSPPLNRFSSNRSSSPSLNNSNNNNNNNNGSIMNLTAAAAGNPFMLNPFLQMAAAAAAAAGNPTNATNQHQALMNNMALFASNFGLNANATGKQQTSTYGHDLWPWFNSMAAMSSLYGIENNSKSFFFKYEIEN